MTSLIVNIVFLFIAIISLAIMLKADVQQMEECGFNISKYYDKEKQTDEVASLKRLVFYAVLLASVSSIGRESVYVMGILAVVILGVTVHMLSNKPEKPYKMSGRAIRLYFTEFILMLVVIAASYFMGSAAEDGVRTSLYFALAFTGFSYGFTLAVGKLMSFFEKDENKD